MSIEYLLSQVLLTLDYQTVAFEFAKLTARGRLCAVTMQPGYGAAVAPRLAVLEGEKVLQLHPGP